MSQNRTFQFIGKAYGNSAVTITATIAGTQIFSGQVPTVDEPITLPVPEADQLVLFTLDNSSALNTNFSGSLPMTLVVSGGEGVVVEQINSNYYSGNALPAGTADAYAQCYQGTPPNSEGSQDPRSSVVINGVATTPQRPPTGTWAWEIPSGQTMTHNFNIGVGTVANVPGNISNYTGSYTEFLN